VRGAAAADILHVYEQVDMQTSPFDPARVNAVLAELQRRAEAQMEKDGIAQARRKFSFSIDMRHRGQINEVEILLPEGRLKRTFWEQLRQRFYTATSSSTGAGRPTAARVSRS
jgi:N-methylhydantoinase A/oxoprolinase/acetone carboxylase beta subunit